jgi:hypothetical protein
MCWGTNGIKCWQTYCMFKSVHEYCESFQLIMVVPEYSFVGHLAQHCTYTGRFRHLTKLTVAHSTDRHWHSHGYHENVHATPAPASFSLPHTIRFWTRNASGDVCGKTQHFMMNGVFWDVYYKPTFWRIASPLEEITRARKSVRPTTVRRHWWQLQNFMFASCSVADVFKCDKSTIHRNN